MVLPITERRAEFASIDLSIDIDHAEEIGHSAIKGVAVSSVAEGRKFRTPAGMLAAVLADRGQPPKPSPQG